MAGSKTKVSAFGLIICFQGILCGQVPGGKGSIFKKEKKNEFSGHLSSQVSGGKRCEGTKCALRLLPSFDPAINVLKSSIRFFQPLT